MRFKKGSKVEVLSKKEVPSGSWHCAEIISGNGHSYDVKYDWFLGSTHEVTIEKVSRKAIRPCPPQVELAENWVPGNILELFDNGSWKIATVLKIMTGNYFSVRLLGTSQEFRVHKSDLRVRLAWKDNDWVVVGEGSGNCAVGRPDKLLTSKYYQKSSIQVPQTEANNLHIRDDCFPVGNNFTLQESHMVSSRTLKRRSPYGSSHVEAYAGAQRKLRAIAKVGVHRQMVPELPIPMPEKVDAVASPQELLGEKYMHASFNNRTGLSEMNAERRKPNGYVGCSLAKSVEPNDTENSACSVGSCSITSGSPYMLHHRSLYTPSHDTSSHSDDAESCVGWFFEKKGFLPTKEVLAEEIHKLELHAYCCTMEALYASGPLSWEQEVLVTNLRLMLHISNDEHLMEHKEFHFEDSIDASPAFSRAKVGGLYTLLPKV